MKNDKNIMKCSTNAFLQFNFSLSELKRQFLMLFLINRNVIVYWHNKIANGIKTKHTSITNAYIFRSIIAYNTNSSIGNAIAIAHTNSKQIIARTLVNLIWWVKGDTTASNRSQESKIRCPMDSKRHCLDTIYPAITTFPNLYWTTT